MVFINNINVWFLGGNLNFGFFRRIFLFRFCFVFEVIFVRWIGKVKILVYGWGN